MKKFLVLLLFLGLFGKSVYFFSIDYTVKPKPKNDVGFEYDTLSRSYTLFGYFNYEGIPPTNILLDYFYKSILQQNDDIKTRKEVTRLAVLCLTKIK